MKEHIPHNLKCKNISRYLFQNYSMHIVYYMLHYYKL